MNRLIAECEYPVKAFGEYVYCGNFATFRSSHIGYRCGIHQYTKGVLDAATAAGKRLTEKEGLSTKENVLGQ